MKKPPLDIQAAARVASVIALADIQFLQLGISYVEEQQESPSGALAWDIPPVMANWHRVEDRVLVAFPFSVNIKLISESDPESRIKVAEASVTLRLEYTLKPESEVSDSDLDNFAGVNGYMHAWPYLRAEIQSLTTKLGLPPLLLPVQLSGHAASTVTVVRVADLQAIIDAQKSDSKQPLLAGG